MRASFSLLPALERSVFGLAALVVVFCSSEARAQSCNNRVASGCINSDTLWPHAGPSRFLSVGSAETTSSGHVSFGLITSYLSRPILLHSPSPGPNGSDAAAIDNQVNGTFVFAYGVTKRLELDAMLPITFGQSGSGNSAVSGSNELRDTATRDARFGFTYAIIPHERVAPFTGNAPSPAKFGLVARFEVSTPIADQEQFAGEKWAVFAPSIAADERVGRFFFGAELGVRLRPTAQLVNARVGSQAVIGAGVGVDLLPRELLSLMVEARVLPILVEQATATQTAAGLMTTGNGTYIAPAEWSAAVRTAPIAGGDLAISLGGGGSLEANAPITTPRFRFTLGIVFAPLGHDTDGDGVLDTVDKCPSEKGTKNSEAGTGCPAPPPKPAEILDTTQNQPVPSPANQTP